MITINNLDKTFIVAGQPFHALCDINLRFDPGTLTYVVGPSGSGKSTLLNMIAGLDRPSRGQVHVAGTPLHELTEDALARFRGTTVGVVFQFFQLLPTLTIAENVMLAMDFVGKVPGNVRRETTQAYLHQVGVADQADKLPSTLSGGQQQRAAIARALANDPELIVADEPTGNLDTQTAGHVLELFQSLSASGKTVVLVTHDTDTLNEASQIITIKDGRAQ